MGYVVSWVCFALQQAVLGRVVSQYRRIESDTAQHAVCAEDADDDLSRYSARRAHVVAVDHRKLDTASLRKVRHFHIIPAIAPVVSLFSHYGLLLLPFALMYFDLCTVILHLRTVLLLLLLHCLHCTVIQLLGYLHSRKCAK